MKIPKYFYFRVRVINKGTGVKVEDASDVDVVEVVRCKDCWVFHQDETWNSKAGLCGWFDMPVGVNDFCSWADRREDDGNLVSNRKCSECLHVQNITGLRKYCHDCEAKMGGESN